MPKIVLTKRTVEALEAASRPAIRLARQNADGSYSIHVPEHIYQDMIEHGLDNAPAHLEAMVLQRLAELRRQAH